VSLILVGINHRTVSVDVLERLTVSEARLPKALLELHGADALSEVVVLSTCNRTEVYADCSMFHPAADVVREFLARLGGLAADDLGEHLYFSYDDAVVDHLFRVAAGIDSMVVGEGEILGQVRDAWQGAEREATVGPALSRAFRHALEVGKRARTETAIGRHAVSVSSAAVAFASRELGALTDRSVLVLGAGEMGEGLTKSLAGAGVSEIVVANRTHRRALELATKVGGRAVALADTIDVLTTVDVFLTSTGSDEVLIERADLEAVMHERNGRPLLVVDIAVPRDVDPAAADVPGITLLDIDDLKGFAEHSLDRRRAELDKVRTIIDAEIDRYRADRSARSVAPVVTAIRARAEAVRLQELERFRHRLDGLDDTTRAAVEALTEGIVNKLLHDPTVALKSAAGTPAGETLAGALTALFDLGGTAFSSPE
jgi:glutamyl-tRNA reductase